MRLGIIANTTKLQAFNIVNQFMQWLKSERIQFVVASDLVGLVDCVGCETIEPQLIGSRANFVLSFGGDGTFLQTAKLTEDFPTPIIGVNLGGFGYLAEVSIDEIRNRIKDLIRGDYQVQDRMMLTASINDEQQTFSALNDIVIDKGAFTRTIRLVTSIDGEFLNEFYADGVIVATPTGSTGYSLSAGGPILEPRLNGIIINPICPHLLANRPLVLCGDRTVEIIAYSELGCVNLAADGRLALEISSGRSIIIKRATHSTQVVIFRKPSFFDLLRNKLQWQAHSDFKVKKQHPSA